MSAKIPVYKIAYYTGTGGTTMVAACFEEALKKQGCKVTLIRIGRDAIRGVRHGHENEHEHDFLLLLFPVHAFNAPEPVYRWIEKQKSVRGKRAAVISVSGGGEIFPNKASRASSIRRLEKKGYHVTYESMMVMPSNVLMPTKAVLSEMLLNILPEKVDCIVKDLLTGKFVRSRLSMIDRFISLLGEMEKPAAKLWGRRIKVTEDCTSCGWCSSHCPSGNIEMASGKPRFGKRCNMCLGCIYGCPEKALIPGIGRFIVLKDGYDIKQMKDIDQDINIDIDIIDIDEEAKGILWAGVRKYLVKGEI